MLLAAVAPRELRTWTYSTTRDNNLLSVYASAGLCVCLCLLLLLLLLLLLTLRCSMHTLLEILIAAAARHATSIIAKWLQL
jgi:hypothetical protein